MLRPHGWGRRWRLWGPLACLIVAVGLVAGGSALGASFTMSTVAGTGSSAFSGDGGPATLATVDDPNGVAGTPDGGFLIADTVNNRIRAVAPDGTIDTVAGNGVAGYNGDSQEATGAKLNLPQGVAALADGSFLIADTVNCRIRRVDPEGSIETVAGNGTCGYNGDGGLATDAELCDPRAAVPTADGGFLIADTGNHVVRYVDPLGEISTVAGTGVDGYDGDDGPATAALLDAPDDVAPTPDGGFLIADMDKDVVRGVSPGGTITTVAGGSSGPGSGELEEPADVEPLPDGGFLIADHGSNRVLRVNADGTLVDFAGNGGNGYTGDGGPALDAEIDQPHGLGLTLDGDVLIADTNNEAVRSVDADFLVPDPPPADDPPADDPPADDPPVTPLETTPEPEQGETVVVTPGFGQVRVKRPGGRGFVLLEEGSTLPVGSVVDVRKGSVVLESALPGDESQTGTFWRGVFLVHQSPKGNGMTDLVLRAGNFGRCRKARRARTVALSSRKRGPVRRLWGKDRNGRFRTHGRDSVATTRGTIWSTEDRCDGTMTRVREGKVRVRHRHSRRSVLVSAGQRYLARRPQR
jgi:hypothetical protein